MPLGRPRSNDFVSKNQRMRFIVLILIVVILAALVVYAFIVKPVINGYVTKIQSDAANQGITQGVNYAISSIINQISQKGYAEVPVGNNQSVILIAYNPQSLNVTG